MKYFYLLTAGVLISTVHFYLIWVHRENRKYSLSEHAIIDKRSHYIYIFAHIITEILFLSYSYQFFIARHNLPLPHYLNIGFAIFDFIQAILPSRGKTEKIHFTAAYISWVCYLLAGVLALVQLEVAEPYRMLAILLLIPILGMFAYMHINRSKLYPYQITIVPIFIVYMLLVTIGAS